MGTRAHFAIRERQRKIRREHALQRSHVCVKKCFAGIAFELEHFLLSWRLSDGESADENSQQNDKRQSLHVVFGDAYFIGSVRRSSLSPMSSRRQSKRTVPCAQISARY